MEETSTENAKVFDSGYSNTGSNSQSYTSSDTLRTPISNRKDKGLKQKFKEFPGKASSVPVFLLDPSSRSPTEPSNPAVDLTRAGRFFPRGTLSKYLNEEVTVVESVDAADAGIHEDNMIRSSEAGVASKARPTENFSSASIEEHYAVISMHDGLVLNATPSLYASLGYPTDWWTGKLFIDFLDHRDKHLILDRIASELAISRDFHPSGTNGSKASIFCRLRKYKLCPSSKNQYVPYRINLVVENFCEGKTTVSQNPVMFLVASFRSLCSAYKVPEELITPTVFTTRHTARCTLSYVDPEIVQYLGYLPQDMINRSLFDFYHPEDLPLIKEIYKIVINLKSKSYKSKPYRFIIQNGSVVVLETEWSCFIHPWTKSVEFVVGQHRVQRGPADPNIFSPACNRKNELLASINEDVLKEAKVIQKEIVSLLVEDVQRRSPNSFADLELLTKKKELTSFAQSILQKIKSPAPTKDSIAMDFSDHESVILGGISPHHEYFDSKSSTETPPSYNQLNYQDNIDRFFNSNISINIKSDISNEQNRNSSDNSIDKSGKDNSLAPELKGTFCTNESGNNGSFKSVTSESINQQSSDSRSETLNLVGNDKLVSLTESLLNKHNEDMEKLMMMKHREQKKENKRNKSSLNDHKFKVEQLTGKWDPNNKGRNRLKRSGHHKQDAGYNVKIVKCDDSIKMVQNLDQTVGSANVKPFQTYAEPSIKMIQENPKITTWPLNSVTTMPTMPATMNTPQCLTTPNTCSQGISQFSTLPQMFSLRSLPPAQPRDNPLLCNGPQQHLKSRKPMSQSVPYLSYYMPISLYPLFVNTIPPNALTYRSFPTVAPNVKVPPVPSNSIPPVTSSLIKTDAFFGHQRPACQGISNPAKFGSITPTSEFAKMQDQKSKENYVNWMDKPFGMRRKEPPWIEDVQVTSELICQYQISPKPLHDVLKKDLEFINQSKHSNLMNDQLEQLYLDLDSEDFCSNLLLEDPGITNSNNVRNDCTKSQCTLKSCSSLDELFSIAPWSLQQEHKNLCDLSSPVCN